jgi:CheY-like chemotaxis protein
MTAESEDGEAPVILLVEDDVFIRLITAEYLREVGVHVIEAANATEAMKCLTGGAERIKLVLTDVQMPGVDGITLARSIRAAYPNLLLMLVSGIYRHPDIVRELGPGTMFVEKPYDIEALANVILAIVRPPL